MFWICISRLCFHTCMHKTAANPKEPLSNSISEVGFKWIICASNSGVSFVLYLQSRGCFGSWNQILSLIVANAFVLIASICKSEKQSSLLWDSKWSNASLQGFCTRSTHNCLLLFMSHAAAYASKPQEKLQGNVSYVPSLRCGVFYRI